MRTKAMLVALAGITLGMASPSLAAPACGVPGFSYAAFGDADITMGGGAVTDSYDSSVGTYAVTGVAANGNLGTNSTGGGAVKLNGAVTKVNGNIDVGFGGTPASVITTAGGASFTSSAALPAALALTPVAVPVVGANLGNVTASGSTVTLVPNSTYGAVLGKAGATIVFPAGTYVLDSLRLVGNSNVAVTGAAIVYIKLDLDLAGGAVVNPSQKATDLVFFGANTLANVKVTGGANAAYAVYAPNASITTSGGASIYGAVVGNTIKNTGGSTLHYDRALASYNSGPFACTLEISRATPIVASVGAQTTVVQGTYEFPSGSKTTIATVGDVAGFAFPFLKGHMRARVASTISTAASTFSAGTVLFDAGATGSIPPAVNAGCASFNGSCRNVFTVTQAPAANGVSFHPPRVQLNDANASTLGALMAPAAAVPGIGPAQWLTIVRTVLAGKLGGVDRSSVAVIPPSAIAGVFTRPTIAYFGSTDGMLHAVCASTGGTTPSQANICPALGTELWAFMPREQLPLVRTNSTRVDGSVRVVDAFGDFTAAATGVRGYATILTFQTGSAPGAVYSLDVTDPANPIVIWEATKPAAPAAFEIGTGLTVASGVAQIGAKSANLVVAQTNNGGTGGAGVVATALALETGQKQWQFGYAYPSPPRGVAADLPLPVLGIPGGAVGVDLLRQGFTTDIVMGDLYGNLWRLDAATGVSRTGATPLFSFATNKHPIGSVPAIYSDGNQQFAVFGSGGYVDPLLASWSAPAQKLIGISLVASGPFPINDSSPALAINQNLLAGEKSLAQVLVVGDELFLTTDSTDVNLATYGTAGNTGRALGYNTALATTTTAIVRGGAGSLANVGTTLYNSSSDQQQQIAGSALSTTGASVDSQTLPRLQRWLWLRTE